MNIFYLRLFFAIFAVFLFATIVSATTWNEVIVLAQKNNNQLLSAQKQLEAARWAYVRSYSGFLPQLSASLASTQTSVASAGATSNYSYGLNATEYLFNGPSNIFSVRSAFINYELGQVNYYSTMAEVFLQVRQAFIDLLIAEKNADLQAKILDRRQENSRLIELRYESGAEDKGNLLRTKANEAQAAYSLSSAQRSRRLARLKLSQLLGSEINSVEGETGLSAEKSPDFGSLLTNSPDYLSAKYQLDLAEAASQGTLNEFLPSVYLAGSYRKSGANWPPDADSSAVSLNVSYSFFPGGANLADKIINNLDLDKARQDFQKNSKDVRFGLESAYEQYNDALENLEAQNSLASAVIERAKIGQEQYIDGLISYTEWDISENEYISAQIGLLNSQKNALNAQAAWYKSYGGYLQ